jgi:hypothetical protein
MDASRQPELAFTGEGLADINPQILIQGANPGE